MALNMKDWINRQNKKGASLDLDTAYNAYSKRGQPAGNNSVLSMFPSSSTTVKPAQNNQFDLGTAYENNQKTKYRSMGESSLTAPTEFKVDMNSLQNDPTYMAAMDQAKRNVASAEGDISAAMNRRGIMDSTINANAASKAAQNAYSDISTQLLPKLIEDQYTRYLNNYNMNRQYAQDLFGVSDKYGADEQQAFTNAITESGVTGSYMPPAAQNAINQILSLKQRAEAPGITAEERTALSGQADVLRSRLDSIGIDASKFGAGVSSAQAMANRSAAGIQTQAAKQYELDRQRQLERDKVADQQYAEKFAYQKASDAISDARWKSEFDENNRQFGLKYALDKLAQDNDQAYRQAQLSLAQDDNTRQWAQFDAQNQPKQQTASPNEVKTLLQNFQLNGVDGNGDPYKYIPGQGKPARVDWVKQTVQGLIDANYDDATISQVLRAAGVSQAEEDQIFGGK